MPPLRLVRLAERRGGPLCAQGEFVTWSKMSAIKANCAIELTFDECMKKVKAFEEEAMLRGGRRPGMGTRIPSYAHMRTAHSMLNIASTGGLPRETFSLDTRSSESCQV